MVKKLTSFLKTRIEWKLSFEAALAGLLLWLAANSGGFFRFIGFIGFIFWISHLYRLYFPQIKEFRFSFLLLSVLSALATGLISPVESIGPSGLAAAVFAVLLFILIGLSNFLFKNNQGVYAFFQTGLLLFVFILFFGQLRLNNFISLLGVMITVFFIFKEFFPRQPAVFNLVVGLVALELAWLVSFLPLGFINAAVFLTLFLILSRDIFTAYFEGILKKSFLLRQLTFFAIIAIVIFASSGWNL